MVNRNLPMQNPSNIVVGGGGGNSSYLDATELKQVDVPTETVIGAANGALKGAVVSTVASALISALSKPKGNIVENLKGSHLIPVVLGTVAFTALGAFVRNAHARMHNKWSDQQAAIMEQEAKTFAERAAQEKEAPAQSNSR